MGLLYGQTGPKARTFLSNKVQATYGITAASCPGVQQIMYSVAAVHSMAGFRGSCRKGMFNALHPYVHRKATTALVYSARLLKLN